MDQNLVLLKSKLSQQQLMVLQTEVSKHKKSTGMAYAFLIFLSWMGVHQFYLKNNVKGLIFVGTVFLPWIMLFNTVSTAVATKGAAGSEAASATGVIWALCLMVGGIMWIYDLFTLHVQVQRANDHIEAEALHTMLPNGGEEQGPKLANVM